jgi:hypothetical protein
VYLLQITFIVTRETTCTFQFASYPIHRRCWRAVGVAVVTTLTGLKSATFVNEAGGQSEKYELCVCGVAPTFEQRTYLLWSTSIPCCCELITPKAFLFIVDAILYINRNYCLRFPTKREILLLLAVRIFQLEKSDKLHGCYSNRTELWISYAWVEHWVVGFWVLNFSLREHGIYSVIYEASSINQLSLSF